MEGFEMDIYLFQALAFPRLQPTEANLRGNGITQYRWKGISNWVISCRILCNVIMEGNILKKEKEEMRGMLEIREETNSMGDLDYSK